MRYFSTFETAKIAGISYECLRDWLLKGFIKADRTETMGTKDRIFKYWTEEGVLKIRKFKDLLDFGFSRSLSSRIVFGANRVLESDHFTITLSGRQTALTHSRTRRRDKDVKDLVNFGFSRSLASRIVIGESRLLKSEYFTIAISARQTALSSTRPGRRDRNADKSIADKILYAVTHDPDGLVELSVFEAGRAASVTLSPSMAAQLARMLTSDRGQLSKELSAVSHVLDACDSIDNGEQPTPALRASAADTPLHGT